jgi:hypothetical protein
MLTTQSTLSETHVFVVPTLRFTPNHAPLKRRCPHYRCVEFRHEFAYLIRNESIPPFLELCKRGQPYLECRRQFTIILVSLDKVLLHLFSNNLAYFLYPHSSTGIFDSNIRMSCPNKSTDKFAGCPGSDVEKM